MLERDVFKILRPLIIQGMKDDFNLDVKVLRGYQSHKQGYQDGAIYINKVTDNIVGYPSINSKYNKDTNKFDTKQSIIRESTYQVDCVMNRESGKTSNDVCSLLVLFLQSYFFSNIINKENISVLLIKAIRNIPYKNEKDNYSYNASFDFIIRHSDNLTKQVNKVDEFKQEIKAI